MGRRGKRRRGAKQKKKKKKKKERRGGNRALGISPGHVVHGRRILRHQHHVEQGRLHGMFEKSNELIIGESQCLVSAKCVCLKKLFLP